MQKFQEVSAAYKKLTSNERDSDDEGMTLVRLYFANFCLYIITIIDLNAMCLYTTGGSHSINELEYQDHNTCFALAQILAPSSDGLVVITIGYISQY